MAYTIETVKGTSEGKVVRRKSELPSEHGERWRRVIEAARARRDAVDIEKKKKGKGKQKKSALKKKLKKFRVIPKAYTKRVTLRLRREGVRNILDVR